MTRSTDTVRKPIASTQIPEYFNQQKILTEMLPGILFIWMMPPQFTSNIMFSASLRSDAILILR